MSSDSLSYPSSIVCGVMTLEDFCALDAGRTWLERRHTDGTSFLIFDSWLACCTASGDCLVVSRSASARLAA